jgi:hypothetical protein
MMRDDLDFTAEDFHKMSNADRMQLCRKLASRARELARLSGPDQQEPFRRIARDWDKLADEMERLG